MTDKVISNEDILEALQTLMQMTSDGFARMDMWFDRLESRMDKMIGGVNSLGARTINLERQYKDNSSLNLT